jgi:hypothetical protein
MREWLGSDVQLAKISDFNVSDTFQLNNVYDVDSASI